MGSYTLSSAATSAAITGCEEVFIARGVTTNQELQTTDCIFDGFYSDDLLIFLTAGQSVTISMHSTALDSYLELWGGAGIVAFNDDRDPATSNDAQIIYTAAESGFYLIVPTSNTTQATGAYSLVIS
jgi:hypothetical protein